jgi:hypothetical protein
MNNRKGPDSDRCIAWTTAAMAAAAASTASADFVQINLTGNQITASGGNALVADLDGDATDDVTFSESVAQVDYASTSSGYLFNRGVVKISNGSTAFKCWGATNGYTANYSTGTSYSGFMGVVRRGPDGTPLGLMSISLSGKPGVNAWLEVECRANGQAIGAFAGGDPEAGVYLTRVIYDHDSSESGNPDVGTQYPTEEPAPSLETVVPVVEVFCHNEKENHGGKPSDMISGTGMNGNPFEQYAPPTSWSWPTNNPSEWIATGGGYADEWQSGDLLEAQTPAEDLDPAGVVLGDGVAPTGGKVGWAVFDLGESVVALDHLYLWNQRENSGRYSKSFNVHVAAAPTVAVPHGPTGGNSRDYDFASGGWTLINGGGALAGTQQGSQIISLQGLTARYVAVEILANNGDENRVGLAEVGITRKTEPPPPPGTVFSVR